MIHLYWSRNRHPWYTFVVWNLVIPVVVGVGIFQLWWSGSVEGSWFFSTMVRLFSKDPYISGNIHSPKLTVRTCGKEDVFQKEDVIFQQLIFQWRNVSFREYIPPWKYIPPWILKHPTKKSPQRSFFGANLVDTKFNPAKPTWCDKVLRNPIPKWMSGWIIYVISTPIDATRIGAKTFVKLERNAGLTSRRECLRCNCAGHRVLKKAVPSKHVAKLGDS